MRAGPTLEILGPVPSAQATTGRASPGTCARVASRPANQALALLLALGLVAGPVPGARAAPPIDELTQKIESLFQAANQATAAGDHVGAATSLEEAFGLLPERPEHADSRALALLDSVRARRRAAVALGDPQQLCAARSLIGRYLKEAADAYGIAAATMDGPSAAGREREEIDGTLERLGATCPSDQPSEASPPAPTPLVGAAPAPPSPPPRPSARRIAGVTSLGIAGGMLLVTGIGLAVGHRAELDGAAVRQQQPTREIEALLDDPFYRRGLAANRAALVGGILSGLAAALGASLLIAESRSPTRHRARLSAGPAGASIGLRF